MQFSKGYWDLLNQFKSVGLTLVLAVSLAVAGCSQQPNSDARLGNVPSHQIRQVGSIQFVKDPALGFQIAAERDLPCLLFFTASWCTYCHEMQQTAFVDPTIGELAKGFICVEIDANRDQQLCQRYRVKGFPTVQFIAADGRALHRLVGKQSAGSLATGMRAASQRFAWLSGNTSQAL